MANVCSGSKLLFYGVLCRSHISIYQSRCPQSPRNQNIMNRVPLSSSSGLPACEPAPNTQCFIDAAVLAWRAAPPAQHLLRGRMRG